MAQRPGTFSVSTPAGRFMRNPGSPKPRRLTCYRVENLVDPTLELWWTPNGDLFFDQECTDPTGLTIVRLAGTRAIPRPG